MRWPVSSHMLTGEVPARALVDRVHQRTDGNPFFVEQLVAAGLGSAGTGPLPPTLRLLVDRRVAGLSATARRVMAAMAIIGRPSAPDEICAVADLARAVVDEALVGAVAAGVVRTDPDGADLRHPIFREVIAGDLERTQRARLHERAAAIMTTDGRPAPEIADHWWEGDDPHRAWASALAAAEVAERSAAFAEARLHLDRALQRWPDGAEGREEAILRAARMAWVCGDPTGALERIRRLPAAALGSVDALAAEGAYAWDAGDRSDAVDVFERLAGSTDDGTPPAIRAKAIWGLGRARVAQGRVAEAADLAARAAGFAADADDPVGESEAWALHAISLAFAGRVNGIPALERAVDLALASGAPSPIGHAYQFLVDLVGLRGDTDRALALARAGIAACERVGLAGSHGSDLRGRAAFLLIEAGDWPAAEAILEPADPRAFPSLARGYLALRRGAREAATREFEQAATGGSIGGPGALGGWLELARAELAWTRDDRQEALRILEAMPEVGGVWGLDIRARAAWWQRG